MSSPTSTALTDRALARSVARHKAMFFPEKDPAGNQIDHEAAVSGGLQLVPSGFVREALADDYRAMLGDGMLPDDSEPFEALIERCADIEARANELEADSIRAASRVLRRCRHIESGACGLQPMRQPTSSASTAGTVMQ